MHILMYVGSIHTAWEILKYYEKPYIREKPIKNNNIHKIRNVHNIYNNEDVLKMLRTSYYYIWNTHLYTTSKNNTYINNNNNNSNNVRNNIYTNTNIIFSNEFFIQEMASRNIDIDMYMYSKVIKVLYICLICLLYTYMHT